MIAATTTMATKIIAIVAAVVVIDLLQGLLF